MHYSRLELWGRLSEVTGKKYFEQNKIPHIYINDEVYTGKKKLSTNSTKHYQLDIVIYNELSELITIIRWGFIVHRFLHSTLHHEFP